MSRATAAAPASTFVGGMLEAAAYDRRRSRAAHTRSRGYGGDRPRPVGPGSVHVTINNTSTQEPDPARPIWKQSSHAAAPNRPPPTPESAQPYEESSVSSIPSRDRAAHEPAATVRGSMRTHGTSC